MINQGKTQSTDWIYGWWGLYGDRSTLLSFGVFSSGRSQTLEEEATRNMMPGGLLKIVLGIGLKDWAQYDIVTKARFK